MGRVPELLKTASTRISLRFPQIRGNTRFSELINNSGTRPENDFLFITMGAQRVTVRQESSFMHQLLMHEMCYATEKMRIGSSDSHYRM